MAALHVDRLVLVRHAMPVVEPDVPADQWELGEDGRAQAWALRSRIGQPVYFVASDEPKAIQTLRELTAEGEVAVDAGFREVHRPTVWFENYRVLARAYVQGMDLDGWEDRRRVIERFAAAVARHAARAVASDRTLVVGTHGLAPTMWLSTVVRLDPNPADFWERLTFPDVVDVDLVRATATRRGP